MSKKTVYVKSRMLLLLKGLDFGDFITSLAVFRIKHGIKMDYFFLSFHGSFIKIIDDDYDYDTSH